MTDFATRLHEHGLTLRRTVIPTLYYVILAGTLTMVSMYLLKIGDPLLGVALP